MNKLPSMIFAALVALLRGVSVVYGVDAPISVDKGQLDGALYAVAKPKEWNGKLLLQQHGLTDGSQPLSVEINTKSEPYQSLLSEGWMISVSSYRRSGFIVRDAIEDVRNLHRHIVATYGKPKRTLLMGGSMGGAITIRLIESDPVTFHGGIVLGSALLVREPDLPDLGFSVKVPVIFMTNQSEADQSAGYLKKAAANGVKPALWIVQRDGHVKFSGPEYLAVVRALDSWADGGKIEMEKTFALAVKEPPSTARFADGSAQGTVREIAGGYGNLNVSFVEADFKQLGIALRDVFLVEHNGNRHETTYANTFFDVPPGKWVCFKDADGYHVIAINFGNAAKTVAVEVG